MSRKFYLVDNIGRERSLQSDIEFMWEPSGLGFAENREYAQVEYGFFIESSKDFEQPEISGTLVFWSKTQEPYQTYHEFVDWVQGAQDMQLKYVPYPGRELYMDVSLDGLERTEKTLYGTLECPVVFHGTSPYHKKNPLTFLFQTDSTVNPMRFTFKFPFKFSDNGAGDAQVFAPQGHFPAAMELTVNGPCSNIYFKAEDKATGELIGALDLSGVSVAAGDRIYYSSRPNADGVWKVSGNTRTDLVESLNENVANFFTLPVGKEVRATLAADTAPAYGKVTRIGGNSVQEAGENMPSPEHPSEIESVGDGGAIDITVNGSKAVSIPIDQPLRALRDADGNITAQDHVDADAGGTVRNVRFVEFNGTENWAVAGASSTDYIAAYIVIPEKKAGMMNLMSSHFQIKEMGVTNPQSNFMRGANSSSAVYLSIAKAALDEWDESFSDAEKAALIKAWLAAQKAAGTPVKVQYGLAEPTRTPIEASGIFETKQGTNIVETDGVKGTLSVQAGNTTYSGETVTFDVEPIIHTLHVHEYFKG